MALHAVSAEPGDLTGKLAKHKVQVDFPIHSDPEHNLLAMSEDEFYIKTRHGAGADEYDMVQPALVVMDKSGAFQQVWSWMTAPLKDVEPKTEMTKTPVGGVLVGVRPLSSDLGPSIKEDRNVKLQGKSIPAIVKEKIGCSVM